jgi:uncharacterized protein YecE (DUF72 family)
MHKARLKAKAEKPDASPNLKRTVYVGCSSWRYGNGATRFMRACRNLDGSSITQEYSTLLINASFYSWPTVAGVQAWRRQPGGKDIVYTVKVCELITHIKKFKGIKTLIQDFGMIADILGEHMGCFLFQLPPSFRYTRARLNLIVSQLDPARRNVVEFRHKSWWNNEVYSAFKEAGIIFCSCSGPRLPDEFVRTAEEVYLRLHGPTRWYKHDFTDEELKVWAERIRASGAKRAWVYFNNDYAARAPKNAKTLLAMLP